MVKKLKICFIPHSSPNFLGGLSLFHKNLIEYIKRRKIDLDITWIYFGNENKIYSKGHINYIKIKHTKIGIFSSYLEKLKFAKILKNNDFDVLSTGSGIWTSFYKKPKKQRLIHTFHGTVYYFNKNHLRKFGFLKKILISPLLLISYFDEKPTKKADKIICVSEKVRKQVENLYGKKRNIKVIRTGVDLKDFKKRDKQKSRRKLSLDKNKIYGLYIGGGGYWTKGLDKAVKLSKEIYKKNKNYRLLIIGSDYNKIKHLINEKFVKFRNNVYRKNMPFYYNSTDIFFCVSRYEGGAPTLVVSEAMASGCLLVCSKDSEQEIIEDEKNGLIIENFNYKDAEKILNVLNDKKKKERIIKNAKQTIKSISLEKWGEKYLKALLYQDEHKI